jgi:hypothetical protein
LNVSSHITAALSTGDMLARGAPVATTRSLHDRESLRACSVSAVTDGMQHVGSSREALVERLFGR